MFTVLKHSVFPYWKIKLFKLKNLNRPPIYAFPHLFHRYITIYNNLETAYMYAYIIIHYIYICYT